MFISLMCDIGGPEIVNNMCIFDIQVQMWLH